MIRWVNPGWLLAAFLGLSAWAAASAPQWQSFDQGIKTARENNKYIFLDFYADWCKVCKEFEATTLKSEKVQRELAQNFVSIKVNTESRQKISWMGRTITMKELSDELLVGALPTVMYLNSDLEVLGNFTSYADEYLFMNLLTYISSGARSEGRTFEEFVKSKNP